MGSVTYTEYGSYPISVTVTDVGGSGGPGNSFTDTTNTSFTVSDAPITDTTTPTTYSVQAGAEHGPKVVLATFTDDNPYATASDFSATASTLGRHDHRRPPLTIEEIPGTSTFEVLGSVTYTEYGSYPISVTVTDVGGSGGPGNSFTDTTNTSFTVSDAPITDTTTPTTSAAPSRRPRAPARSSWPPSPMPNPYATASDFSATVNWGGPVVGDPIMCQSPGRPLFEVRSVTYTEYGTYPISVTVTDVGSARKAITATASLILPAPASTSLTSPLTDTTPVQTYNAVEGSNTGQVVLATFTDANPYATASDFTPHL